MKNKSLLIITLFTLVSTHAYSAELLSIDCNNAQEELVQDYENYLQSQLKFYQSYHLSFSLLMEKSIAITGANYKHHIRDTQNEDGNTFLHVAVKKQDLFFTNQILSHFSTMHTNNQGKTPFDLILEQLQPNPSSPRNNNQLQILESITDRIAQKKYLEHNKLDCLKKIIALELSCRAYPDPTFSFIPSQELLLKLVPKNETDAQSFLSQIYQQTIDKSTGNTFGHVFVQQEDSEALFELVKADRVSHLPNKENLNVLNFALRAFRQFTSNSIHIDTTSEKFQRARCCFFILYNYFKTDSTSFCCDKHKTSS